MLRWDFQINNFLEIGGQSFTEHILKNVPISAYFWILSSICTIFYKYEFDVNRIRTCIIKGEGTYADHLTTTTEAN